MLKAAFHKLAALGLLAAPYAAEAGVTRSKSGYFNDKPQCNSIAQNAGWTSFITLFENDPEIHADWKTDTKAKFRRSKDLRTVLAFDQRFAKLAPTKEQLVGATKKGVYEGSWLQPHGVVSADAAPRRTSLLTFPHGIVAVGNEPLPDFWFAYYALDQSRAVGANFREQLAFVLPYSVHDAVEAKLPALFEDPGSYVAKLVYESGANVRFELFDVTQRVVVIDGYTPLTLENPKEASMNLRPVMQQVSDQPWRRDAWVPTGRVALTGNWNFVVRGQKFLDMVVAAQRKLNRHVSAATHGQRKVGYLGLRLSVRFPKEDVFYTAALPMTPGLNAILDAREPVAPQVKKNTCF